MAEGICDHCEVLDHGEGFLCGPSLLEGLVRGDDYDRDPDVS